MLYDFIFIIFRDPFLESEIMKFVQKRIEVSAKTSRKVRNFVSITKEP